MPSSIARLQTNEGKEKKKNGSAPLPDFLFFSCLPFSSYLFPQI